MRIIADMHAKGKALLDRLPDGTLSVIVVMLACFASFGLGVLTGQDTREGEIQVEELSMVEGIQTTKIETTPSLAAGGQYVASRTGRSYHLPWCSGAKQIKEENKIYFATKEAAEAAGYAPAKNCKGL